MIALEDEKSAPFYFKSLRNDARAVRTVIIAEHIGSDPMKVVEAAARERDKRTEEVKRGEEDDFEEIWVVFDTEGPQNMTRQTAARNAIHRATVLGFRTAVSNPCFEYWTLCHFEYHVGPLANGAAVRNRLREHIPKYDKGRDWYPVLREHVDAAIDRAKRVFDERHKHGNQHPCDCHPCTEVYRLVVRILGRA